ncbi:HTH-type transcriptional regulator GalS [compost metagenome]
MAAGALRAAAAFGLAVPRDLAVAGFDDSFIAGLAQLTSVRQPTAELARRAVTHLIAAAGASRPPEPAVSRLACTIVERDSTATRT